MVKKKEVSFSGYQKEVSRIQKILGTKEQPNAIAMNPASILKLQQDCLKLIDYLKVYEAAMQRVYTVQEICEEEIRSGEDIDGILFTLEAEARAAIEMVEDKTV